MDVSYDSALTGGLSGITVSVIVGKLFLNSVMSHIDTLKLQNVDCERRYDMLRKDFTVLQHKIMDALSLKQDINL